MPYLPREVQYPKSYNSQTAATQQTSTTTLPPIPIKITSNGPKHNREQNCLHSKSQSKPSSHINLQLPSQDEAQVSIISNRSICLPTCPVYLTCTGRHILMNTHCVPKNIYILALFLFAGGTNSGYYITISSEKK